MIAIPLHFIPGKTHLYLREVCAADELAISAPDTYNCLRLLEGLIENSSINEENSLKVSHLPIADRDYVLADIYQRLYGQKIESTLSCQNCSKSLDIDYYLPDLVKHVWDQDQRISAMYKGDGTFMSKEGVHFRLPNGEDELIVSGLSPENASEKLQRRCLLSDPANSDLKIVEELMERIAPLLSCDLSVICPECNTEQEVFFSLQSYLLNAILEERPLLIQEIHLLAYSYKWSHQEIINLPRSLRKLYVRQLLAEFEMI